MNISQINAQSIEVKAVKLLQKFYKYLGKVFVLDVTKLFVLELEQVSPGSKEGNAYEVRELDFDDLTRAMSNPGLSVTQENVERLSDRKQFCVGALDDGDVVGYVWFARNSIDGENNRGDHPDSGVSLSFPEQTLFMYNGFTHADHRGRSLIAAMIRHAIVQCQPSGVTQIVTTSDWTNTAAHRALQKLNFSSTGHIWRIAWLRAGATLLPRQAADIGVRLVCKGSVAINRSTRAPANAVPAKYPG